MHVQRNLLDTIKKDRNLKRKVSNSHSGLNIEIQTFIPILETHLKQSWIEKTSNWMLYKDLWLQNEAGILSHTTYRNYTRGSIIMSLDWGTSNIGTEIRYPHPGVVLYDQKEDWVIAAPITGARLDKSGKPIAHPPFEVLAPKQKRKPNDPNEYWFRKHSVIQVDQVQRISKYRAMNKNSYKIKDNLIKQIDNILLENYIPGKYKFIEDLKLIIQQKDKELEKARLEIERLELKLSHEKV